MVRLPIITIDPGHGGRQPGAIGPTGVQEKNVCLAVALRVRELLRVRGHAEAHLTRETDIDVPLSRRLPAQGAVAYVSIHCNAHSTAIAHGTETFWLTGGTAESRRLAEILQRGLIAALGRSDRGVKTANFRVLHQGAVPAALVELAFISHPTEEALLESEEGRERAARAIAGGVAEAIGVRPQPAAAPPQAPSTTPAAKSGRKTHLVIEGDTLFGLARRYNVTVAQLREWNSLPPNETLLRLNQRLFVQG